MKRFLIAALTLVCTASAMAADTQPAAIPPGEAQAKERIDKSSRHVDFVDIKVPGIETPMKTCIVYPERPDKAPVVIVIMEIFGLSDWLRATTDQLAADGFIAIAPDFLSGKGPNGGGTEAFANRSDVTRAVQGLKADDVTAALNAAREYALTKILSANGKVATMGFCWGGGKSFAFAASQDKLDAAVVFYGTPPADDQLAKINAPVMGFYGGNDQRISATVPATTEKMKKLGKFYEGHVYDGAGHGFMRSQDAAARPADLKAAKEAWPAAITFLKEKLK